MELWQTEKQIYDLETTYLEETSDVFIPPLPPVAFLTPFEKNAVNNVAFPPSF